jgi:hypothetical protein
MKIRPVGAEVFHVDRRPETDRHNETNRRFSLFAILRKAPKNEAPQRPTT